MPEPGPSLPDMKDRTLAELRELLSHPEFYIPEAVHQAARELASRNAIPRYHLRLKSPLDGVVVRVHRQHRLDYNTKIKRMFSEYGLRKYCFVIAVFQFVLSLFQIVNVARIFQKLSLKLWADNYQYFVFPVFTLLSSVFLFLFFSTLYRTLKTRTFFE